MQKILLIIIILLVGVFSFMSSTKHYTTFFNEKIKVKTDDTLEYIDLEEYLIGVVASEMPALFHIEALKAQAVCARTYALYKMNQNKNNEYHIISGVINQGYITNEDMKEKWQSDYDEYYNKIKSAVDSTKNLVIKKDNKIIEAFYFSMSNGYTENSENVFALSRDYLKTVEVKYDNENLNGFKVTKTINRNEFCNKLNINCNEINITNEERAKSGRVNKIVINDKSFKGTEIRKLLDLRSTDFNIKIMDNEIEIETKGYGHGVGMSQYGALGMAKDGYSFEDILKYYYNGVEITTY